MKVAIGQPAEHLPHWKQRRTDVSDSASTLRTKSMSIVSCEITIFFFFTGTTYLVKVKFICLHVFLLKQWFNPSKAP